MPGPAVPCRAGRRSSGGQAGARLPALRPATSPEDRTRGHQFQLACFPHRGCWAIGPNNHARCRTAVDAPQPEPRHAVSASSEQILHARPLRFSGAGSTPAGPLSPGRSSRFGPTVAVMQDGGEEDALDNLCSPAGFVGAGDGNVLHGLWADSHPARDCVGSDGRPSASRTQDYRLGE